MAAAITSSSASVAGWIRLVPLGLPGAPDPARAGGDQVVGGGGLQHRAEQPVGVRPHDRGAGVEAGVPGPHGGRGDHLERHLPELGHQQPVEDAPVVVLGAGLEAALVQPPGGVPGERLGPGGGVAPGARRRARRCWAVSQASAPALVGNVAGAVRRVAVSSR